MVPVHDKTLGRLECVKYADSSLGETCSVDFQTHHLIVTAFSERQMGMPW